MSLSAATLTSAWSIVLSSADPVARFAAQELRRTLQRIGAPPLPVVAHTEGPRIALHCGANGDGFLRTPDAAGLTLRGDGPRGLLYAVYDLLEELDCRWVAPGPTGERLPHSRQVALPTLAVARRPALAGRCLIIGHDFFLDSAEEWIVWAARNRLNAIFIHTIDQPLALGACHIRRWRERRPKLLPLLRERGMQLELGGHSLRDLTPRHLFRRFPDAFRHNGDRRTPDHNFCPSSPVALDMVRRNGAAFFRAHPEVQIFHFWPADILGGGWCHCAQCRNLSPADQALIAINALAAVLAEINPQARLAYLAYHDTEAPPACVAPGPNVALTFAPRPRSYAHAIADPDSPVNVPLLDRLKRNLALFNGATPGDRPAHITQIFEYYLDGILFKSALPPLPTLLCADLRAYRDLGVHTVQALMTGDRPWLAAPLNAYLFARLAWEPEQDPAALVANYAAVRAPRTPAALLRAYCALEAAWRPALQFAPAERMLRDAGLSAETPPSRRSFFARLRAIIDAQFSVVNFVDPPTDVLDYMAAPRPLRERRLEALAAVEPLLAEGRAAWDEALAHAYADAPHLAAERAEWEASALLLHYLTLRQQLYVLEGRAAPKPALRTALRAAQAALDALLAWGDQHLPTRRARSNYRLLRLLAQIHLDAIYARRLAWPWQRVALRLHRYRQLVWLVSRNWRP